MSIPLSSTRIPNRAHHHPRRNKNRRSRPRSPQAMEKNLLFPPDRPGAAGKPIRFHQIPPKLVILHCIPTHTRAPPNKNPQNTKLRGEKPRGGIKHRNRRELSEKQSDRRTRILSDDSVHPILAGCGVGTLGGPGWGRGAAARCLAWEAS